MIKIHPAESRYSADHGWLKANFSFSFAEYHDPDNVLFGPLRVFNDDIIAQETGFGMHPHRDMEIVTVVLKGQLQHRDNMGHTEILGPGEVQRMSAGTGVVHSEVNPSETQAANTLQLWFLPMERGIEPSYEQLAYDQSKKRNNLLPVVSHTMNSDECAYIHQDLTLYLSDLDAGHTLTFEQKEGRLIYVFLMEGDLSLNGERLNRRDAARITDVTQLQIATESGASFMLIDLPPAP